MDNDIQQLRQFLQENMASKVDIAEIAADITDIKSDVIAMKQSLNVLQIAVDSFAKSHQNQDQENTVKAHQLSRIEDWIKKAADKIGIAYNP